MEVGGGVSGGGGSPAAGVVVFLIELEGVLKVGAAVVDALVVAVKVAGEGEVVVDAASVEVSSVLSSLDGSRNVSVGTFTPTLVAVGRLLVSPWKIDVVGKSWNSSSSFPGCPGGVSGAVAAQLLASRVKASFACFGE